MPIWLVILIIVVGLLTLFGYILMKPHRPPSGPKGPRLTADEFDTSTFVRPRPPQDNARSHHPTNGKK